MSLSKKIKLSFVIIIIFPLGMIALFGIAFGKCQIDEMEKKYDIDVENVSMLFDRTSILNLITESVRDKLHKTLELEDFEPSSVEYWENFNEKSCSDLSTIIVNYDDNYIYNGISSKGESIVSQLPEYDSISDISVATYYVGGEKRYLVKPVPFTYEDGNFGTVYIIGMAERTVPEIRQLIIGFALICVILITITGACLTIWLYKSVLGPINRLKKAAQDITKGNLEFSVKGEGSDEFTELYDAFEDMRIHLKESIDENLQNDRESKELISNISHDLKTPITAIKGYVEGIMDGVADTPEKMDKYIKTIYNKANDMDRLIGELTVYSKIDTNRIPYHFVKLNVAEYFDDCIDEISTELESKGFKLTYLNYIDKSTEVIADPEQIKRVINNIISNSLKYNDKENGVINIRIKDQKDYVHFEFEDNGKGVAPGDLPYIFERFYRTDTSRNSKKGGSGIGLSIVKKIIEAHGGTIWAFSTLNTGLSIHFILKKADCVEDNKEDMSEENNNDESGRRIKMRTGKKSGGKDDGKEKNIDS